MDSKQFDELVTRLASAATRRNAVKGVVGGALASVGVTSVATAKKGEGGKGKAKGKGKGKAKGKGNGKAKGKGNGNGKGNKHGHSKVVICHKGKTMEVPEPAVQAHLDHGDSLDACYGDA
jgi:hypothetical protein